MARRALVAALAVALLVLVAPPARAVIACNFDEPTGTVTITLDNGDVATVVRSGDAITIDNTPCGTATVNNTDTINVSSAGTAAEVQIDLSGGPFAPGETPETDGASSEIEWLVVLVSGAVLRVVGSNAADSVVVGVDGINLDATEATADVDVVVNGAPTIVLEGADGDDLLSAAGGAGTGAAIQAAAIDGGPGADTLAPGAGGDTLDGGDGPDTVDYAGAASAVTVDLSAGTGTTAAGEDTLVAIENATGSGNGDTLIGDGGPNELDGAGGDDKIAGGGGDDTLDGGAGTDLLDGTGPNAVTIDLAENVMTGQGTDSIRGFENAKGGSGNDRIDGDGQPNSLEGGGGADRIDGAGGPDVLAGGTGNDTVSYGTASRHVVVDLAQGTSTGAGADTLTGFENVIGGPKEDVIVGGDGKNVLDGRSGADEISGGDGQDRLVGANGADILRGQGANDLLLGDAGRDQLDGGPGNDDVCRGGEDPDSFVNCENYRTRVPGNVFH